MKRLGRWAFNIVAGLSLVLCLATVVVWVRSYFVAEAVIWTGVRHGLDGQAVAWSVNAWSAQGAVGVFWDELRQPSSWSPRGRTFTWARDRMRVYPYVPVPDLARGRYVKGLGVTLHQRESRTTLGFIQEGPVPTAQTWLLGRERAAVLPYWLLLTAGAVLPACGVWRWQRRHRSRARLGGGLCPNCSYDLRATPDRCPECGTAVPAKQEAPG